MISDFEGFLSQILSITFFCPMVILEKEPVVPFLMLFAKQGNYWYHFYNVFGMMRYQYTCKPKERSDISLP